MSRMREFKLPDLGEGLTEGEILQWMVAPGDTVTLNQVIVEVETAKAAVEVPSPFAGVVTEIHHEAGSTVDVGAPIITFDTDPSAGPLEEAAQQAAAGAAANPVESAAVKEVSAVADDPAELEDMVPRPPDDESGPQGALIGEVGPSGRTATLVGYGPKSVTAVRRPRRDTAGGPASAAAAPDQDEDPNADAGSGERADDGVQKVHRAAETGRESTAQLGQRAAGRSVLAKPPVRKRAKELGVDLGRVQATGPAGRITRDDVERAGDQAAQRPGADPSSEGQRDPASRERRLPIKGVRKLTAAAMVDSAFTAPHVTEFVTLDITPTMELRQRVAAMPEFAGVKVSPLLFVAKALLLAVSRNSEINSSWDEAAQEIVVKDYVNLGIAAATPRGLIVSNVKDADQMSLPELAGALTELTTTAREGRTPPADMAGGTLTITNVGVFGVDNGTPILNPGEAAILCFGAVRPTPWVVNGEIMIRQVTQLSLSFDHRLVDGQLGSQFLADIARVLSDPTTALVWG